MLNYYKLEQRDSFDMHKTRTVYRILTTGHVTDEQFIKEVAHRSSFSESVIAGVLNDVRDELAELLGEGYSVTVPGIGAFSLGVRLKEERQRQLADDQDAADTKTNVTEPNARNIELHHLNFRKDRKLFRKTNEHFNHQTLKRVGGKTGRRITIDDTSQQQRIEAARQYLREHYFMHVGDYAEITGLSYSSAQRELRELDRYQYSGIHAKGRGSHRVYVLSSQ